MKRENPWALLKYWMRWQLRSLRLHWLAWRWGIRRRRSVPAFAPGSLVAYAEDGSVRPCQRGDSPIGVVVGTGVGSDGRMNVSVQFGGTMPSVSTSIRFTGAP
jgi:hypothetical protein